MTNSPLDAYSGALRDLWEATYSAHRLRSLWGDTAVPFVDEAVRQFETHESRIVLDLGCGDGRNTYQLATAVPFLVGVDISPSALELCRLRLSSGGVRNCLLVETDAFDTPFKDGQFDGIFCANLLGQVRHPSKLIREAIRIARCNAPIIFNALSTEDPSSVNGMVRASDHGFVYDQKYYYQFFEREQMIKLFTDLGLDVVAVSPAEWIDPPHEGYREEAHQHRSWVITTLKGGDTT